MGKESGLDRNSLHEGGHYVIQLHIDRGKDSQGRGGSFTEEAAGSPGEFSLHALNIL